jgi:hypothetical protein
LRSCWAIIPPSLHRSFTIENALKKRLLPRRLDLEEEAAEAEAPADVEALAQQAQVIPPLQPRAAAHSEAVIASGAGCDANGAEPGRAFYCVLRLFFLVVNSYIITISNRKNPLAQSPDGAMAVDALRKLSQLALDAPVTPPVRPSS